jgi:Cu/Ag efflux protein CusF
MRTFFALLCLALIPAALADAGAPPTAEKKSQPETYPLRGVVVAINAEKSTARIKHDKIPGLMGAMTMEFHLAPAALKILSVGQTITATLYLDNDDFWLRDPKVLPTPSK